MRMGIAELDCRMRMGIAELDSQFLCKQTLVKSNLVHGMAKTSRLNSYPQNYSIHVIYVAFDNLDNLFPTKYQ